MRRMRQTGNIPAVLYGHGKDPVHLMTAVKDINRFVQAGHQFVKLNGAVAETALIKDVQWDAFGTDVLHVDFLAVDATEAIEVSVTLEFKGDAPGANMGGIVNHVMHELTITCAANAVPEHVEVVLDELQLNSSISAGDLELPSGVTLVTEAEQVVATCNEPVAVEEPEAEEGAEPEVVGEDKKEEEGGDE